MKRHLILCLVVLLPAALQAAEDFPGLDVLMSSEQKAATGVDDLTDAQRRALDAWLADYLGASTAQAAVAAEPAPTPEPAPQEYGKAPVRADVVSTITGRFTGWDGNTVFNLDNGQVYVQRRPGRWKTELTDPEVRITRNIIGAFELEVVGHDHSIGVRRLK